MGTGNIGMITCTLGVVEAPTEISAPSGFQWDQRCVASSVAQELSFTSF